MRRLRLSLDYQQDNGGKIKRGYLTNILSALVLLISIYLEYTVNFHRKCMHIMYPDILVKDNFPRFLHNFDAGIMKLVNPSMVSGYITIIFISFTLIGGSIFLLGYIISMALRSEFKDALIILTALLITMTVVYSLKTLLDRPRPFLTIPEVISVECIFSPSFPSGHAARFAVLPGIQFEEKSRYRYIYLILSFIVGFSRIYLGVHYPSDVIVGWVLGYMIGFLSSRYFKEYITKIFSII